MKLFFSAIALAVIAAQGALAQTWTPDQLAQRTIERRDSWVIGPVLKMIGEFEASVKKHPLIAMGTPDPYVSPSGAKP